MASNAMASDRGHTPSRRVGIASRPSAHADEERDHWLVARHSQVRPRVAGQCEGTSGCPRRNRTNPRGACIACTHLQRSPSAVSALSTPLGEKRVAFQALPLRDTPDRSPRMSKHTVRSCPDRRLGKTRRITGRGSERPRSSTLSSGRRSTFRSRHATGRPTAGASSTAV